MKAVICLAVLMVFLAGCGVKGGGEYVGRWVNVQYDDYRLNIERNGEGFMVRDSHPSPATGKPETKYIPATYKEGQLLIATDFGNVALAIDKASGHLTNGKTEYRKVP
ncbi:hypothetical protein [Pseudoduganella aquatica]|uniref:hypothetical protein n=1 Tax=Pseudoduganella aquatica TaxID=2660641 RepID=UPI001E40BD95|nr:hypothetical protein [Pseudoduganella aquatica]